MLTVIRWSQLLNAERGFKLVLLKLSSWLDGSLFFRVFFRIILGFFDGLTRFLEGSFVVRLFSADFDRTKLSHSYFVRIAEGALNLFPKSKLPVSSIFRPFASLACFSLFGRQVFQGSKIFSFFVKTLENTDSLASYGLLVLVVSAPFLPTMTLAPILVAIFAAALFHHNFKLDLTSVPLLLFVIITIISGFTSAASSYSLPIAVLTSVFMLSYLLVKVCFTDRLFLDFVMALFVIAAACTALVAIFQVYAGYMDMSWVDRNLFAALRIRVTSTFGNPNVYGTYLLLVIPLSGALVIYAKSIFYKFCALGITGLLLIALGLTYSRGCYVALAAALFVFLILVERRLIVLFAAGLIVMPFVLPAGIIARIVSIVDFTDTSTMYRISIWQASLRMLGDFWMAGIGQGPEAYNNVYPYYAFSAVTALHSHNLYLQIFLETGIVGLLVFIGILACFFRTQFSFMRHTAEKKRKLLSAAMTAAVVGFLIQGIFDHAFYNYRVMLIFFLYIGLANALTEVGALRPASEIGSEIRPEIRPEVGSEIGSEIRPVTVPEIVP